MNLKKQFCVLLILITSFSIFAFDEADELRIKSNENKIVLTKDEEDTLKNGDLGGVRYTIGGVLGTYPLGLGIGHAVQGRWGTAGWKFTSGELLSLGLVIYGVRKCGGVLLVNLDNCKGSEATNLGLISFVGFRIWEIIDVWYGGYVQMNEYPILKQKILGNHKTAHSFFLIPEISSKGTGLRFGMSF